MTQRIYDRSMAGLLTAEQFVRLLQMDFPREDGWTHAKIGERLGLSAGFVGMLLSGHRKPSKAVLDARGMEAVVFYRLKNDPFTGEPWSAHAAIPPTRAEDQV